MIDVKICGLNAEAAVDAALAGGARWLGFVIFAPSPRHVSPERAAELAARAAGRASIVAVTVDAGDDLLADIQRHLRPHWIQLHGGESPDRVRAARAYAQTGIIKALPVGAAADLDAARAFEAAASMFLFDATPPAGATRPGGWGEAFDWTLLKTSAFARPWLLSGGLDPANVRAAIAASGARAVDVSSGVESAPGVKDEVRIAAFLAAVRDIAA